MKARIAACLLVIAAGLILRFAGHAAGLPFFIVQYGGSCLWGTMLYFIIAIPAFGWRSFSRVLLAIVIATAVELFRLYHTPNLMPFG